MFRTTLERVDTIPGVTAPLVVGNTEQRMGIDRELRLAGRGGSVVLEPVGRNTAPAVAVAALELTASGDDPILLVLPADHVIRNLDAFVEAVQAAARFADQGYLVTFGITPTGPETGYGYIRFGQSIADNVRDVDEFVEKPDAPTAEDYVTSGRYLWNSGMFLFRASRYLAELERHEPDVLVAARAALNAARRKDHQIELDAHAFAASPSISIDVAVMERTDEAAVVPISAGWSDVGSWDALWSIGHHDENGNVVHGDALLLDVTNTFVRAEGVLVAAVGLDNMVIVDTPDATLVARRDRSQDVKRVVEALRENGRHEADVGKTELRRWGRFETLTDQPGYRVRRLVVDPGGKSSMEIHRRRKEHWIVIRGSASVSIGQTVTTLGEGETVFIAPGQPHGLENLSADKTLEIIAVAVG